MKRSLKSTVVYSVVGFLAGCGVDQGTGKSREDRIGKIRHRLGAPAGAVAVGERHSCAALSDGRVKCWGQNEHGQLGDGTLSSHWRPGVVSGITNAAQVVAGGFSGALFSCARLTDGGVRCWGANDSSQLGDSTTTQRTTPVAVSGLFSAVQIAAGARHACAILGDGSVRCWGANENGQLGDGTTTQRPTPVAVAGLLGATQISLGAAHSCAVLSDGSARCWGLNANGQLGDGTNTTRTTPVAVQGLSGVSQISAGNDHTCALAGGGVRCSGNNAHNQLGDGTAVSRSLPVAVLNVTDGVLIGTGTWSSWVELSDGSVWAWGDGMQDLGDGQIWAHPEPWIVPDLDNVTQFAGGFRHHCAVLFDGSVQCWGKNSTSTDSLNSPVGRPGRWVTAPTPMIGLNATQIGAGGRLHACGLLADGHVQCWGAMASLLGDGTMYAAHFSPRNVVGLDNATAVSAGESHSCATIADGSIACWGGNAYGQLGDGTTLSKTEPVPVVGIFNATGVAVGGWHISRPSQGGYHSCATTDDGGVYCWGCNLDGQLGDGTTTNRPVPTRVVGLTGPATQVSVGDRHSCALVSGGLVQCWGYNGSGELGDGTSMSHTTPVSVSGLTDATQISIGGAQGSHHTCAIRADTSVVCWGANLYGQLGDGTTTTRLSPVPASSLAGVMTLALASSHSCALLSGGAVRCWGDNLYGQIGDGTTTRRPTPTPVLGLPNVVDIAAGGMASWAVLPDGSALGWGSPPGIDIFYDIETPIDIDLGA